MRPHASIAGLAVGIVLGACKSELAPRFGVPGPAHLTVLNVGTSALPRIVSQPPGIECGTDCEHTFDVPVVLTASGGTLVRWGSPCAGDGIACSLTLATDLVLPVAGLPGGTILWEHWIAGNAGTQHTCHDVAAGYGIATASGQFDGLTKFPLAGGGTESIDDLGSNDTYLLAVNTRDGEPSWRITGGSSGNDSAEGVRIRDGAIFWTGRVDAPTGTWVFGDGTTGTPLTITNAPAMFLQRLTLDGAQVTSLVTDVALEDEGIRVDSRNGGAGAVVAGDWSQNAFDVRVTWIDGATIATSQVFSGTGEQMTGGIVGIPGGAMLVGWFQTSLEGIGSNGDRDGFALSMTSSGSLGPIFTFGGAGTEGLTSIDALPGGGFLAGGWLGGGTAFPDGFIVPSGQDALLLWLDDTGDYVEADTFGGPANEYVNDVDVAESGAFVVCGEFSGTMSVGGLTADPAPGTDAFVVLFDPDKQVRWLVAFGGPRSDEVKGCAFDDDGAIIVGGRQEEPGSGVDAFFMRIAP